MDDRNDRPEVNEIDSPLLEDKTKQPSGQYLWRVLKPAGCILVLLLFVLYLVFCFTYRGTVPQDGGAPSPAVTETE